MKGLIREFKEFLSQGNVVDFAVAVVFGAAFKAIIDAFIAGIIEPIIASLYDADSIATAKTQILGVSFGTGLIVSAVINFVIIGFVLFLVVKAANMLKRKKDTEEEVPPVDEVQLLSEIRDLLKKEK